MVTEVLPKVHPEYGGTLIYLKDLKVGDRFWVTNGAWDGEIIEVYGVKMVSTIKGEFIFKDSDYLWVDMQGDK